MSSLGIHEIRSIVMAMYPESKNWHARVSRMPDNQVYAIYRTNLERRAKKQEENWPMFHQIDIFEWLNEKEGSHERR